MSEASKFGGSSWFPTEFGIRPNDNRSPAYQVCRALVVIFAFFTFLSPNPVLAQGNPIHSSVLFQSPISVTTTQPYMNSIAVADFDVDGLPDVVVVSDYRVAWYRNNGNGTFDSQRVISTALGSPFCVFAADMDNDGRPDVLATSLLDSQVVWFRNEGTGATLFGGIRVVSTIASGAFSVSAADLDGDGLRDILSTSVFDGKIAWYRNLGGGNFGSPTGNQQVILAGVNNPASISATDLDGDGIRDLLVTSANTLSWLKGSHATGTPQFTNYVISNTQTGLPAASIADVDKDGRPDVVCVSPTNNSVTWFRNRTHDIGASAPFFGPAHLISNTASGARSVIATDFDHDGAPDVAVAAFLGNKVTWYQNLATGDFAWNGEQPTANEKYVTTGAQSAVAVAAGDFNQDGTKDAVVASQPDGKVTVFLNIGGQCAMASANTAPASMVAGSRDDVLRIAISNRGLPGDNHARVSTFTLLFEKNAGVVLTTAEANALIDSIAVYVDSNNSGSLEFGSDAPVGIVSDLPLAAGRLVFAPQPGNTADISIAAGATRNFFVVARLTPDAATQTPNAFRVTHLSQGGGRSVIVDATSSAVLTVEPANNPDTPSSLITAQQAHTYADWSTIHFDVAGVPGTSPTESQFPGGMNHLFSYAFAANPLTNTGAVALPRMRIAGATKSLRHHKLAWSTDLTYGYEISRDMVFWEPAIEGIHFQKTDTPLPYGVVQSDLVFLGSWTKSFMKVRVSLSN